MRIYTCEKCKYTFEWEAEPVYCPDCGKAYDFIREATIEEVEEHKKYHLYVDAIEQLDTFYRIGRHRVMQIQLPDPNDQDEHPRLIFNEYGIHTGDALTAWLPDGAGMRSAWSLNGTRPARNAGIYRSCPGFAR